MPRRTATTPLSLLPRFYTLAQAAVVLNECEDTLREYAKRGWIRGAEKRGSEVGKRGGRWRFDPTTLAYVGPGHRHDDPHDAEEELAEDELQAVLSAVVRDWKPSRSRSSRSSASRNRRRDAA